MLLSITLKYTTDSTHIKKKLLWFLLLLIDNHQTRENIPLYFRDASTEYDFYIICIYMYTGLHRFL